MPPPSCPPPAIWSSSWIRNFERIIEWSDAVCVFAGISHDDYKHYSQHKASRIEERDVQDIVMEYAPVFGELLEWIQAGIAHNNASMNVPEMCVVKEVDFYAYKLSWHKHINHEVQSLSDLRGALQSLIADMQKKKALYDDEESGGYSSYSDYSEEETESEEDEVDDDNEAEEPNRAVSRRHREHNNRDERKGNSCRNRHN